MVLPLRQRRDQRDMPEDSSLGVVMIGTCCRAKDYYHEARAENRMGSYIPGNTPASQKKQQDRVEDDSSPDPEEPG